MPAYVYEEVAQKSINVEPCPCCRSEDIKFGSYDGDESVYCSAARVECNKCGHKIIINERDMGGRFSGKECQFAAIDKWNLQSKEYGGSRKAEDGEYDRLLIERLIHENMTLKTAITLIGYAVPSSAMNLEVIRNFRDIMSKFNGGKEIKT